MVQVVEGCFSEVLEFLFWNFAQSYTRLFDYGEFTAKGSLFATKSLSVVDVGFIPLSILDSKFPR